MIGCILSARAEASQIQTASDEPLRGFDLFTSVASRDVEGSEETEDEIGTVPDGEDAPGTGIDPDEDTDPDSETVDLEEIDISQIEFLDIYNVGVSDYSVAYIQQRLMDLGFMDSSEPTEYYGIMTSEAVKLFQRQNDLKQDGVIGSQSIAMLLNPDAKSYMVVKGMEGEDIKTIQNRLYELGYLASKNLIDGKFGEDTESAVKSLQSANGLVSDGKIGTMTMELMYSEEIKANILSFGDKSEIIKTCQTRLKELGYLTTAPDGSYGNDTLAAVKLFQSKNNLVVDGYLGPSTREVLESSSAIANGLVLGDEGDTVKRVQELLIKYGYMNDGAASGYFGETTDKAVKAFQKANGLFVDGDVGAKTMAKLTGNDVVRKGESADNGGNDVKDKSGSSDDGGSVDTGTTYSGSVSDLLKVAKSKLGCKYVYGSKGPNTFDCSGFVYWCLNQVGVKQSYITSYGWRTVGKYKKISKFSDLKAGDVIVVKGHVGIVAESGTVVDASSSSGKIVHRSLSSWWKNSFVCGWRIFD
ncbi:MAG: peptidoglycan-binding protein [Lachnospiraceae bacterium]|nr:peptidoglycan-binding protein [Lachnospiraceae bacterium]